MIVTDKFAFVHFPRTGGTFITNVIKRFFPSQEVGYHLPRAFLPKEYSHLPVLGAVRNPWEFYVSWYHHVWPRDAATPLTSWLTENGKQQFEGATRNALNIGTDSDRLDALIEKLPDEVDYCRKNIPNITKEAMRQVRGTGLGYYTFRFNHLYGSADDMFLCRLESLRQNLLDFFDSISVTTDELRDYVLHSDKQNTADHLHYSTYYTPELAELVSLRDRPLIERFGYVFEQAPSIEIESSTFASTTP